MHKKIKSIRINLLFKRLLHKVLTECKFTFAISFYRQTDVYKMGGPLSVTFRDLYMVEMERYINDMFSWNKKNAENILFYRLNLPLNSVQVNFLTQI